MPARVCNYLREKGQVVPAGQGQIIRIILESLAFKCRYFFEKLEKLADKKLDTTHIVGGGSKNSILNQFMANALKVPVVAGPVEATSLGNVLMQLKADGAIKTLAEGRALVADSFPTQTYQPESSERWDEAYGKFLEVVGL